jgi:murein tripeptide amidase MpaA
LSLDWVMTPHAALRRWERLRAATCENASTHFTIRSMFRTQYLDYSQLVSQLSAWARQHASIVRVTSIGKSAEGRDIPLLTIGARPDEQRPAVWVDGNMHASELAGSSVALAIAEEVIGLHTGDPGKGADLPAHMREVLKETLFYVLPRISPDGAEAVLKQAATCAPRRSTRARTRAMRTGRPTTSTATAASA